MIHFGTYILTYLHTYILTYVQVIFQGTHPTLKLYLHKMSQFMQVHVPIFFILPKSKKWPTYGQKTVFLDRKYPRILKKLKLIRWIVNQECVSKYCWRRRCSFLWVTMYTMNTYQCILVTGCMYVWSAGFCLPLDKFQQINVEILHKYPLQ